MEISRRNERICPRCERVQSVRRRTCSGCGAGLDTAASAGTAARRPRLPSAWQAAIVAATAPTRGRVVGQAVLLAGAAWVTATYLRATIDRSQRAASIGQQLLESANLVFHEAGHWIFGILGVDLLTIAGGSLLQLIVPAVCAAAFLTRHPDPFAASFSCWWAGQSAVNLAPYVADARAQRLILLGGVTGRDRPGFHDWNNLLGRLGLLEWDAFLGALLHWGGLTVMAAGLIIGAQVLQRQWQIAGGDRGPASIATAHR